MCLRVCRASAQNRLEDAVWSRFHALCAMKHPRILKLGSCEPPNRRKYDMKDLSLRTIARTRVEIEVCLTIPVKKLYNISASDAIWNLDPHS